MWSHVLSERRINIGSSTHPVWARSMKPFGTCTPHGPAWRMCGRDVFGYTATSFWNAACRCSGQKRTITAGVETTDLNNACNQFAIDPDHQHLAIVAGSTHVDCEQPYFCIHTMACGCVGYVCGFIRTCHALTTIICRKMGLIVTAFVGDYVFVTTDR